MSATDANDLRSVTTHFRFGKNWSEYAAGIDEGMVEEARKGLRRLLGDEAVEGKSFLDIGCGSGIHSLSALRAGFSRLTAVDLDPDSVNTTRRVLSERAGAGRWECVEKSVFDLDPATLGQFEVVYSWGVLHHTGAMHEAIRKAAAMVAPGGLLILALYRRTTLCGLWKIEKRVYSRSPGWAQRIAQAAYTALYRLKFLIKGGNFREFVKGYRSSRGMSFRHDVHDWLGGYPYESVAPGEAESLVGEMGFSLERSKLYGKSLGILGSACNEYVFRRSSEGSARP